LPLVCPKCGGTLVLRHASLIAGDRTLVAYCENYDKCDFEIKVRPVEEAKK